jgi:hypothetical protein
VRRYFDGCNSGDLDLLLSTLTPDVVHYFLPPQFPPIKGAEHLAKYWRKYKAVLNPIWSIRRLRSVHDGFLSFGVRYQTERTHILIDHIIAQGIEVVSEWSCIWTPRGTETRLMSRGSEWYVMRDARIAEVRAYFMADELRNTELAGFSYGGRGYLIPS